MISSPRRLVLLGHPVTHSLSPVFQNAAIAAAGIDARYEAVDVDADNLASALAALAADGCAGNVTVPHKPAVAAVCAWLSRTAMRTGAVNTFWTENGRLCGDNTDVGGFDAAARALLGRDPRDITVALIGAGGSASAVLAAVETWPGARALVCGRNPTRVAELAARFRSVAQSCDDAKSIGAADLVVNATPLGLTSDDHPLDVGLLAPRSAVLDLVYRPNETAWVRAARAAGHASADGLTMLVEQGALAFELWFGRAPDREVMWRSLGRR